MCFPGGGGDDSSSREMIEMQKQEAAKAEAKEQERQARIKSGLARIKEAFHGKEVTKTVAKNPYKVAWPTDPATRNGGQVPGLPTGYKYVYQPGTTTPVGVAPGSGGQRAGATPAPHVGLYPGGRANPPGVRADGRSGQNDGWGSGYRTVSSEAGKAAKAGSTTAPGKWVVQGPDGKFYQVGSSIDAGTEQVGTGKRTGGIGDDFYNNFKQGILDFYTPQVARKYSDAQKETTYRLADAGTLRSSTANDLAADLYQQNLTNTADVRSKADTAAGDLRNRVASEEAKAVSQLYATENPDVAANQALHAVTNLTAEKPTNTPLGDIFSLAAIGGAKFLQGADNAAFAKRVGALPKPAQRIV
jgi:hypothetical protein